MPPTHKARTLLESLVRGPRTLSPTFATHLCLVIFLIAAGCGKAENGPSGSIIRVTSSVSPITNLVSNVGGKRVMVSGLVPEGVDSHRFEPRPKTVAALSSAQIIFVNGLGLEDPLIRLAKARAKDVKLVALGEKVPRSEWIFDKSFPASGGHPNPHLWTSPAYARVFVERIAAELAQRDPEGSAYFRSNAGRMISKLTALDDAIQAATNSVEPERRKLITYHDSFPYFARDYGWKVIAAIQPANFHEPSARDVALIVQQIKDERVPAIFGSEVFPSPTLELIARKSGARYIDSLRDDDLPGEPGEKEHSYIGLMRFDVATIVDAMGGDDSQLLDLDTTDLYEGNATYG